MCSADMQLARDQSGVDECSRSGAHPLLLWAALVGLTVVACAAIGGAYFLYEGTKLPRASIRLTGDWLMERDDEMGFVPTRNGSTELHDLGSGRRVHFFTDARHARVDAPGMQTPDRVDVMTVGCSFTWGADVESPDTYTQQLGRILNASVANFGMGSYGSVQAFQTLVRHADLKPRVIVYGFIQDHLRRNLSPCGPNYVPFCLPVSYLERRDDWIVLQSPHMEFFSPEDNRAFNTEVVLRDPSGPMSWLLAAKWAVKIAVFKYRHAETIAVDGSPETAALGLRVMIGAMAGEAEKIGAKLVVLHMPYLRRGHVQPAPEALTAAVGRANVTFVDFAPVAAAYYERDATGTLILGDDPHPNPLAHRLIAETLAPVVGRLLAASDRGR
jgi:hypothetical protein